MATVCYPYVRFSTGKQADGDSVRRQSEKIEAFIKAHGFDVDTRYEDHAVSSFRGKNATKGQLSIFLQKVRDGEIAKGSVLLIENWDRLSRQVVDASIDLFSDIIRAGMKIAVLDESCIYEDLTSTSYIRAIVQFERAHKESERKSDFSKNNWKGLHQKMASGEVVTKKCPSWLRVEGGKFVEIPEITSLIRDLFQYSLSFGLSEACRKLNEKHGSSLKLHQAQYYLKNRRLTGEHMPVTYCSIKKKNVKTGQVIPDYYPQIISPSVFENVAEVIKGRRPFAGRQDKQYFNILRDLVVCSECGGSVRYMHKGAKQYYYCTASMSDQCVTEGIRSIRGEELRQVLFYYKHWTNITSYLSQSNQQFKEHRDSIAELRRKLALVSKKTSDLEEKWSAEEDQATSDTILHLLTVKREEQKEIQSQIELVEQQIRSMESAFSLGSETDGKDFVSILNAKTEEAVAERGKLNNYLKSIFQKIVIDFKSEKLTTVVRPAFEGIVTPVTASIPVPADKRFTKGKAEGEFKRIGGGVTKRNPDKKPKLLEIPAELEGVVWKSERFVKPSVQ